GYFQGDQEVGDLSVAPNDPCAPDTVVPVLVPRHVEAGGGLKSGDAAWIRGRPELVVIAEAGGQVSLIDPEAVRTGGDHLLGAPQGEFPEAAAGREPQIPDALPQPVRLLAAEVVEQDRAAA